MNSRLKSIILELRQRKLNGLIVSLPANISYLVYAESRDSYLLVSEKENIYFTDSRYSEEAGIFLKNNARLKECNGGIFKHIAESVKELGLTDVGIEERYMPFAEFSKIKELAKGSFNLIPTYGIVEGKRVVKDASEIVKIKQAMEITSSSLEYIKKLLAPGIKEIEVAGELERFMRYKGASGSSFDIIVGSGPNSSQPHHLSGQRKLRNNEPVLIDFGVDCQGYKTDLTRVLFLGKIKVLARKVYDIVLRAQEQAIKRVAPGAEMAEIDRVARRFIAKNGYAKNFTHNLGHGVGLEVHEEPRISGNESTAVRPGMVFTIEPGIYLPGKFGIRIEDMVLVTNKGCEVLSGFINK